MMVSTNLALLVLVIFWAENIEGGLWEGVDIFEGVGAGIGKGRREFKAEIYIEENSIQGVGTDESGNFRMEGSVDKFSKTYEEEKCKEIEYRGVLVNQNWINGTYKFTECSTADYKAKNPFLGLFAPSSVSGSGTFEVSCKTDCQNAGQIAKRIMLGGDPFAKIHRISQTNVKDQN
eukprot:GFUD01059117.1.p1 GENE.GFUD01059117.1~~GFUD01059117.1.p1  ORF type:complete len:176 (+),score=35.38 GFUD01059117.1:122-649(+)